MLTPDWLDYFCNCWFPCATVYSLLRMVRKTKIVQWAPFCRRKHLVDERGQWRMARQFRADIKLMVTQITTLYNCGEQKSITMQCTKHHNLSAQPIWMLLLTLCIPWPQCTHLLIATSSMLMHHVTKQNNLKLVSWTWEWVQCSSVAFPVTRSESNSTPLGCGRTGFLQHECAADKFAEIARCNHVNMEQNLQGMFSTSSGIHAMKNYTVCKFTHYDSVCL